MNSLKIERHNIAGRHLAHAIRKGTMGNLVMIGDVGNTEKCAELQLHGSRVPEWLLDDHDFEQVNSCRKKARPDLMIIGATNQQIAKLENSRKRGRASGNPAKLPVGPSHRRTRVLIIEVGYTTEVNYKHKLMKKQAQHAKLETALKNRGFNVETLPIILGSTGGVFHSNIDNMLASGISREQATMLLTTLSKHAREYMQAFITARRALERQGPP